MRKAEVNQLNTSVMCGVVGSSVFLLMCNFPDFVKTTRSSSVAIAANTLKQEWKQFAKFIFQTQFSKFRLEIVFFSPRNSSLAGCFLQNYFFNSQQIAQVESNRIVSCLNAYIQVSLFGAS